MLYQQAADHPCKWLPATPGSTSMEMEIGKLEQTPNQRLVAGVGVGVGEGGGGRGRGDGKG